jgi:hypothetical protein
VLAVAVLGMAIAAGLVSTAGAVRAKEFGRTKSTPPPACSPKSTDDCQITGQVTGFQRSANGKRGLFRAPSDGKIVAWSVDLSKPSKEARDVFGEAAATDEFGKSPTAGIGILRKKDKKVFRLMRQSPVLRMQRYYGETPIFTLDEPLRINEGNIVALTTATWLPSFAFRHQGSDDTWLAGRSKKDCEIPDTVPPEDRLAYFFAHTRPHRKLRSDRKYACLYDSARILYWAYFVPRG